MMNKQVLVKDLLQERLAIVKMGIIVKGIEGIKPDKIAQLIVTENAPLFVAAIGYDDMSEKGQEHLLITDSIEKAVSWRSMPKRAGKIPINCILWQNLMS